MIEHEVFEKVLVGLRQIIRAIDLHSKRLKQKYGLTGPQLVVLRALGRSRRTVGELASAVSLSHATVTGVLDRLEQRGLVRRTRSAMDKRCVNVEIEPAGLEILAQQPSMLQEQFIRRFMELEEWEQLLILSSLQRVAAMMEVEKLEGDVMDELDPLAAEAQHAIEVMPEPLFEDVNKEEKCD